MDKKERNRIAVDKYRLKNRDKILAKEATNAIVVSWASAEAPSNTRGLAPEKTNPVKSKKTSNICSWKILGIISDDWDKTYDYYINTHYCEYCDEAFKNSKDRNLDHDHSIKDDLNIRGVLCRRCNTQDVLKDYFV